jgi:hypothetical protein
VKGTAKRTAKAAAVAAGVAAIDTVLAELSPGEKRTEPGEAKSEDQT